MAEAPSGRSALLRGIGQSIFISFTLTPSNNFRHRLDCVPFGAYIKLGGSLGRRGAARIAASTDPPLELVA